MCRSISTVAWLQHTEGNNEKRDWGDWGWTEQKPVMSFEDQSEEFRFNAVE